MTKKNEKDTVEFPAWFYGPGGVGEIFNSAEEVPEGWVDCPKDAPPAIDL